MPRRKSTPAPVSPSNSGTLNCYFCGSSEDNEVEFGKFWNHDGIVTHYYCLLLSSNMEQNGRDHEGILGFLTTDIRKELRRGKKLHCVYCKRTGATLGCCNVSCKRVFHLPCGLQRGSFHQFFGKFRSYCVSHRLSQEIDEDVKADAVAAGTVTCYICYEEVCTKNFIQILWAPCCRINAWFHRKCVQRLALSAGYFFKCPLCNNKPAFQKAMRKYGIFIPSQDASWELVPNAYQELLHRHNRCDAVQCLCPEGRNHDVDNPKWKLVLCRLCGSQGIHKACALIKWTTSTWECAECVSMLRNPKAVSSRIANGSEELSAVEILQDGSSSDSDISVGRNPSPLTVTPCSDSSLPLGTPLRKLQPGPLSFKLRQAARNTKSVMITRTPDITTSVPESHDVSSTSKVDIKKIDLVSDKVSENHASSLSQSHCTVPATIVQLSTKNIKLKDEHTADNTVSSNEAKIASPKFEYPNNEVILLDSDDESEIINVAPKKNTLTARDGTQIPIHNLLQASAEPHKAEGNVKIGQPTFPNLCKKRSPLSKVNTSIGPDNSSALNIPNLTLISSITPQVILPRVLGSPVTSKIIASFEARKSITSNQTPGLVEANKDVARENSKINIKITDVTSLHWKNYPKRLKKSSSFRSISLAHDDVHNDNAQPVHASQTASQAPTPTTGQLHSQLCTTVTKDINMKRKTDELTEKNASSLSNQRVMQNSKKAKTCEPLKSGIPVQNKSLTRSINLDERNSESIPLVITLPSTHGSHNSEKFQTKADMPKPNALRTYSKKSAKLNHNSHIPSTNGIHKNSPKPSVTGLHPMKLDDDGVRVNSSCKPSFHGTQKNVVHTPKVAETCSTERQCVQNSDNDNVNLHNETVSGNQHVNISQNFAKTTSGAFKPLEQSSTQQVSDSTGGCIPTLQCMKNEVDRHRKSVVFHDSSQGNRRRTSNSNSRAQPNTNDVARINQSLEQQPNRVPIPRICDGSAGSGSATDAPTHHRASSKRPVWKPAEPITGNDVAATKISVVHPNIANCVATDSTIIAFSSGSRKYCDASRVIPENVPLRNLDFSLLDSQTIQIIIRNSSALNIRSVSKDMADYGMLLDKQKLSLNKSSSNLYNNGSDLRINISTEYRPPSNNRNCIEIDDRPKKFSSLKKSHNSTFPGSDFKKIKCNISYVKPDQTIPSIKCVEKMNSVTGTASATNGSNDKILTHDWHKDNLFKQKWSGLEFMEKCEYSKNLCERDENIISVGDLKKKMKDTSAGVKNQNIIEIISMNERSVDKKENRLLNEISERSIRNFDELLKFNLPVRCYTNLKKTGGVRRSQIEFKLNDLNIKKNNLTTINDSK